MKSDTKAKVNDKKSNILFFVALLIGLLVAIIISTDSKKMEYTEQKFGVIQDYALKLDDSVNLKIDFKMEADNFQGISVYLLFSGIEYEDSYLNFALYDKETDEVLGTYSMDLEYEYSGKYAYAELPVRNSQNRDVYLLITGQNIKQPLQLKVSKKSITEQKFYKNDVKVSRALVMNAVYGREVSNAINVLINYVIYAMVLLLIYYNKRSEGKSHNEKQIRKKQRYWAITNKLTKKAKSIWGKYKDCFLLVIIVFTFACIFAFYYNLIISDLVSDKKEVTEIELSEGNNFLMDSECSSIQQSFTCSKNKFSGISLLGYAENIDADCKIKINIIDEKNGITILEKKYFLSEIVGDKEREIYVPCNENIKNSKGKEYIISLEILNAGKTKLYIAQSQKNRYKEYVLCANDNELQDDIALKVTYSDQDFILIMYCIFICLIFIALFILYYVVYYKRCQIEKVCFVLTFTLGILYMFVLTIYSVPDEASHIDTAYRYSNRLLGIDESNRIGYDYKRMDDVDALTDQSERTKVNISSYQRLYNGFFSKVENDDLVECYMRDNSSNGGIMLYCASTIGLTVARILHWGTIPTYLTARFFNLLAYCILVYIAIKILPYGKTTMALLATLPISLQQAVSFSYDSLLNGCAMLFIAYCLYLANSKRNLLAYDILIVAVLTMLLVGCKGGVYMPMCLLVLYIPYKRGNRNLKSYLIYGFILITAAITFAKSYIVYLIEKLTVSKGTVSSGANGSENYTFGYLLKHPLKLVSLFCNTIFERTDAYLQNVLGGSLGWLNIYIPWTYLIIFAVILLVSTSVTVSKINRKDRIIFMFISICSFLLVNLSMLIVWTPKASDYITGVQGRYFLPFIFLTLVGGSSQLFQVKKEHGLILTFVIMHCLVLLRVVVTAL